MILVNFSQIFPEVAKEESTIINIFEAKEGINPGSYLIQELYCTDADCPCAKVKFIIVLDENGKKVDFDYGWKSYQYYKKFCYGDEELVKMFFGLVPGNSGGKESKVFFDILESIIEKDKGFVKKIKKHYKMMKGAVDMDNLLEKMKSSLK